MLKHTRKKSSKRPPSNATSIARDAERRALARSVRVEKSIQQLTKALRREMLRSNDALQSLAVDLAARARALEADRESAHAVEG